MLEARCKLENKRLLDSCSLLRLLRKWFLLSGQGTFVSEQFFDALVLSADLVEYCFEELSHPCFFAACHAVVHFVEEGLDFAEVFVVEDFFSLGHDFFSCYSSVFHFKSVLFTF